MLEIAFDMTAIDRVAEAKESWGRQLGDLMKSHMFSSNRFP